MKGTNQKRGENTVFLPARPLPPFCAPQPPRAPREDALDEGIAALRRLRGLNVSERLG